MKSNDRRWLLLIAGLILAMVYLPHWFRIPYPVALGGYLRLAGQPYFSTYVDYSTFFEPFSEFARQHVLTNGSLPLWNTYALLGLPQIEQSEHSILNPLQWLLWLGHADWRLFLVAVYLVWGAWGLFRLLVDTLRQPRLVSCTVALLYALAGAAPHGLGDFCCLVHVMLLPHVLRQAVLIAAAPAQVTRPFLVLTLYLTLLLLTGQPQYLLVGGMALGLVLLTFALLVRRPTVLLLYAGSALIAALLAAPMLNPFLEANLAGLAYPGNHQLVGSASYWKINALTFSQLLCHRLTGFVGLTWFAADKPSLAISYESFSIAFGSVAALAALVGSFAALRYAWRRRVSVGGALRAALGIGTLALFGLLVLHNLSGDAAYPWFFRFVNLAKYSPPVLSLLLCLAIPDGMRVFAHLGGLGRALWWAAACALPGSYLFFLFRAQASTVDNDLRTYSLLVTFLPLAALGVLAWAARMQSPTRRLQGLALVLGLEVFLLASWGMPLGWEYWRCAWVTVAVIMLALAWVRPDWRKAFATFGLVTALGGLWAVRQQTVWHEPDRTDYLELRGVSRDHVIQHGYTPRMLTSQNMTHYPFNAEYDIRTIVSRCPVVPLATQALLFDYIEPRQLLTRQRSLSFLEFHGAIPPGAEGYLSWSHFAADARLLDLLGIDYLVDYDSGPLAGDPSLLASTFPVRRPMGRNLILLAREQPLGRARFHAQYATVAYTPDAWNVRRAWRDEDLAGPHRPVVEIDSRRVPKWEEMVQHQWFEVATRPDTRGVISYRADRNGHFSAHVATDGPGLFVFHEQFWPGWVARLNGAGAPVLRVDSLFQGVLLPSAGSWDLDFQYVGTLKRDLAFTLAGSLLTVLAVALIRRYYQPVETSLRK